MKKNLPLIIIVFILVSVLAYLKYNKSKLNFEAISFHIEDINQIGSITISDKSGNQTTLRKIDNKWMVNDSFIAEKFKIKELLFTLSKLQIEMPVGDSMRPLAIKDLRTIGRKVTIMDLDGDEMKTFYLGSAMGSGNNTILSEDGIVSTDPYIVKIPGIKSIDLKHHFPAIGSVWHSTEVFSTQIDKIKKIVVNFHEYPNYSFKLSKDEDLIKIDPLIDSIRIDKPLNQEHILNFLLEFEAKNFEGHLKNDRAIAYVKKNNPVYTIELEDVMNIKRFIRFYKIPSSFMGESLGQTQLDASGNQVAFKLDKYWVYSSYTKDYAIAQHYVFGPILLPYSYFFEAKK